MDIMGHSWEKNEKKKINYWNNWNNSDIKITDMKWGNGH